MFQSLDKACDAYHGAQIVTDVRAVVSAFRKQRVCPRNMLS